MPRFVAAILPVVVLAVGAATALGQDYPNKPVRFVTSAAGGGSDFTARMIAQGVAGAMGQQIVVDNRNSSILSSEAVSKAPPDGYTLLVNGAILWVNPLLTKSPYEVADFAPVSLIERSVNIVAVNPSLPVKSIKELIALAKARPGDLNYGSAGVGGTTHLATELFKSMAGVNIVHVPYKGNGPALTDLISGQIQISITSASLVAPYVKAGRLRALAVTSTTPSALTPGLPTVAASGVPGFEAIGVTGMFAPAKTSAAIISRLSQEISRTVSRPEVKEKFFSSGVETIGSTPEEFAAFIKSDSARIARVIKDAGIKID